VVNLVKPQHNSVRIANPAATILNEKESKKEGKERKERKEGKEWRKGMKERKDWGCILMPFCDIQLLNETQYLSE
jgi:hypothetical protein